MHGQKTALKKATIVWYTGEKQLFLPHTKYDIENIIREKVSVSSNFKQQYFNMILMENSKFYTNKTDFFPTLGGTRPMSVTIAA